MRGELTKTTIGEPGSVPGIYPGGEQAAAAYININSDRFGALKSRLKPRGHGIVDFSDL